MTFQVPPSKGDAPENQFLFKIKGTTYKVPKMQYLDGSIVDQLAAAAEAGGIVQQASEYALFGPATSRVGKAVRTLDSEQLDALQVAYAEASGVSVGESSGSDDS